MSNVREAFEVWYPTGCPGAGITAKLSARAGFEAGAAWQRSQPAHDADASVPDEHMKPAAVVNDRYSRDGSNDEISVLLPVGTHLYTASQLENLRGLLAAERTRYDELFAEYHNVCAMLAAAPQPVAQDTDTARETRRRDSEEAVKLQRILMEHYSHKRPVDGWGLFDWAAAALQPVAQDKAEPDSLLVPKSVLGSFMSQATVDVIAERRCQISAEGWTPEHDDTHDTGTLASAAGCYAMYTLAYPAGDPHPGWPWDKSWWKPSQDSRRNLVKAGALILAEIERHDRLNGSKV